MHFDFVLFFRVIQQVGNYLASCRCKFLPSLYTPTHFAIHILSRKHRIFILVNLLYFSMFWATLSSSTAVSKIVLEDNNMVSSLITLGTPHVSPDTALIDQTRGLLREVAETSACSSDTLVTERGIDVTCLCSSSFSGNFITTNIEEFVAASSYLPLLGKTNDSVKGDGIVPLDLAFMEEPARKVILPECPSTGKPIRHSHVLPTPWNLWDPSAKSIVLDDTDAVSYMSPGVVQQWAQYIR